MALEWSLYYEAIKLIEETNFKEISKRAKFRVSRANMTRRKFCISQKDNTCSSKKIDSN